MSRHGPSDEQPIHGSSRRRWWFLTRHCNQARVVPAPINCSTRQRIFRLPRTASRLTGHNEVSLASQIPLMRSYGLCGRKWRVGVRQTIYELTEASNTHNRARDVSTRQINSSHASLSEEIGTRSNYSQRVRKSDAIQQKKKRSRM
jgi:hypothetical protein